MSTPLNFKSTTSGGSYGTHSNSSSNSSKSNNVTSSTTTTTTTRRRTNPADYGPFSSPHASFDDPQSFPPYAELPFTSLKRRRQLQQDSNSFVKWAMRCVLLSPVVVLVLWSIVALVFANPRHGHSSSSSYNNGSNRQSSSSSTTRRSWKRMMMPPYLGSGSQAVQSPLVYMQPGTTQTQPQLQQVQGISTNDMNGGGMMMVYTPERQQVYTPERQQVYTPERQQVYTPERQQVYTPERQQVYTPERQQSQQIMNGQAVDQQYMATASVAQLNPEQYVAGYQQQQQQQQIPAQQNGKHIPVVAPLGNTNTQQQQPQQQMVGYMAPQSMAGTTDTMAEQNVYMATNNNENTNILSEQLQQMNPQGSSKQNRPVVNHRRPPRATHDGTVGGPVVSDSQPVMTSTGGGSNTIEAAAMQQQQADTPELEGQQQVSPAKQAIYYYDPKDTAVSQNGDILRLPKVVYDSNGKAIPLSELKQAPIYVQPPMMGSTSGSSSSSGGSTTSTGSSGTSIGNAELQDAPAREVSLNLPKWGKSSSQDQTIIVATVAVMALLVGALSARRLRSKSFLSSCIENETLEDDLAYDSAYTTTAVGGGADSSYNTFGGWKGDLEKFDV